MSDLSIVYFILVPFIVAIITNNSLRSRIFTIPSKLRDMIKNNDISRHFHSIFPSDCSGIDLFFYPLGLKKILPIMDWFYFEYIKYLNTQYKIKKLVIWPYIDNSCISQEENDLTIFSQNIEKLFKNTGIYYEIVDPYKDKYFDMKIGDLNSEEFLDTLKLIGSKKYFDYLQTNFKLKITNICDINKYRPDDNKILYIFLHICKSWSIVNYIKEKVDLSKPTYISAIFWEWQIDKIGVIKRFLDKNQGTATFCPVLGKTQASKGQAIPDMEQDTICIFDDIESMIKKFSRFMPCLRTYNSLLECVLLQYENSSKREIKKYGKQQWKSDKSKYMLKGPEEFAKIQETSDFFLFWGLITKIKSRIDNA